MKKVKTPWDAVTPEQKAARAEYAKFLAAAWFAARKKPDASSGKPRA